MARRTTGDGGTNLMNQHHHQKLMLPAPTSHNSIADIGEAAAAASSAIRQMQLGFGDASVMSILSMPHRQSASVVVILFRAWSHIPWGKQQAELQAMLQGPTCDDACHRGIDMKDAERSDGSPNEKESMMLQDAIEVSLANPNSLLLCCTNKSVYFVYIPRHNRNVVAWK